jgi:hypothetical protein
VTNIDLTNPHDVESNTVNIAPVPAHSSTTKAGMWLCQLPLNGAKSAGVHRADFLAPGRDRKKPFSRTQDWRPGTSRGSRAVNTMVHLRGGVLVKMLEPAEKTAGGYGTLVLASKVTGSR